MPEGGSSDGSSLLRVEKRGERKGVEKMENAKKCGGGRTGGPRRENDIVFGMYIQE